MKTILIFLLTMTTLFADDLIVRKDWHVLVKTRNGTISLIRNLTLAEAQKVYESLEDRRGPGMYFVSGSEVETREILGPDGWDGCKKSFRHRFESVEEEVKEPMLGMFGSPKEPNPDFGRRYTYMKCQFCGASAPDSFAYCDGKK